jgi:sorbitol-specific phosphotransferase system component IIA
MTVKELMKELAKYDEDMVVVTNQNEGPEDIEEIEIYHNQVMIG